MTNDASRMTLREHFEELRWCLIRAIIGLAAAVAVCWFLHDWTMQLIVQPLRQAQYGESLKVLEPAEGLLQYLKVDLILGLVLASPWVGYQIWTFVGKGLQPRERQYVYVYAGLSVLLFVAGVAFAYFIMLRLIMQILIQFDPAGISTADLQFSAYVSFFFNLTLAMGLVFQVPVVMRFLSGLGLVSRNTWKSSRKYAIVVAFLIGALVTPADPISQITAAIPIVLLYEIGIFLIPANGGGTINSDDSSDEDSDSPSTSEEGRHED